MSNSTNGTGAFGVALIAEARRRIAGESLPRILKCLDQLTDEEIWRRPNNSVVSVGNLVLHLSGNIRQWIVSGLGGEPDNRVRDEEFETGGPLPRQALVDRLTRTIGDAETVLEELDPERLLEPRRVQGQDETGLSMIVHVVEHFSYHTGQISLHVKLLKDVDLGYYSGLDLNAKD